jgi:hypothetical protein
LTPDAQGVMEGIFWYSLGLALLRTGVKVCAACVMSTHYHLVIVDENARLPEFLHALNRNLALAVKAYRGWPAEVFDKCQASAIELVCPEAVIKEMGYTSANPTKSFAIELPAMLTDAMTAEEARGRIALREREVEREGWDDAQEKGHSFLGAERALRQPHTRRARSYEKFGSRNPRFSAGGNAEAAAAAIARNVAFDTAYDEALKHWCHGDRRRAVFPAGTWWMRVHHNARCRPP